MNKLKTLHQLLNDQTELAIATATQQGANVRIMNFYYQPETNKILVATFPDNQKVAEFTENPEIAFTTIPKNGVAHVKGHGRISHSPQTIYAVADGFTTRIPGYDQTILQAGDILQVYEINLTKVTLTLNLGETTTIEF